MEINVDTSFQSFPESEDSRAVWARHKHVPDLESQRLEKRLGSLEKRLKGLRNVMEDLKKTLNDIRRRLPPRNADKDKNSEENF